MAATVEVLANKAALVQRAYELVLAQIQTAIDQRGRCTLALAGGSTPKPLYEALAQADLPWDKLYVFWGDERYVPADHPDSNAKMARQAWLNQVAIPTEQIYPVPTDDPDPAAAAAQYEQTLRQVLMEPTAVPSLDIILLGMGDDGHTASLFPHTAALQVCDRIVSVGNKDGQPRITFTVPLINAGRYVLFLAAGANKRPALRQVFAPTADANAYPSRLIQPLNGGAHWLIDQSAAVDVTLPV